MSAATTSFKRKADDSTGYKIRRSLRSSKQNGLPKTSVVVQIDEKPLLAKRKAARAEAAVHPHSSTAISVEEPVHKKQRHASHYAPYPSSSTSDHAKREKALLKKEKEYQRKLEEYNSRASQVAKAHEEAKMMLSQVAEREAETTLSRLEDHFTCPLCLETMACPISLNPGNCGHTFCALCILKWFFSRLHKGCGGWHEAVDCPICRSTLAFTPDRLPRSDITFPFIPNRTGDKFLQDLISKLATTASGAPHVKRGMERGRASTSKSESPLARAEGWRDGGAMKSDWARRDRDGREKMNYLRNKWATLTPGEFVSFKASLRI